MLFALFQRLPIAKSPRKSWVIVGIFTVMYPFLVHCITVYYYILYRKRTCGLVCNMNQFGRTLARIHRHKGTGSKCTDTDTSTHEGESTTVSIDSSRHDVLPETHEKCGMLRAYTKVTNISSEHERVSYSVRVILILSLLHLRRADALVGCVVFPRLLAVGVGCVCLHVIFVHAATIIPKYYVLNLFFCIFAQLSVCYQDRIWRIFPQNRQTHTDTDTHTHCHNLSPNTIVTTKSELTCVIEHYADLDQPSEILIVFL
jgi:hypothetical protein